MSFWEKNLYLSSWWSVPQKDLRLDEFLPLKVENAWKEPRLHLRVRLYTDDHVLVDMFVITPGFVTPSIQTSTNLCCTCNQNQLTWSRGELFGLETCCFGQRPDRVWISADPNQYSLPMWEISLWFGLKYKKNTPIWEVYRQPTEQKAEHQVVWTQLHPDLSVLRAMLSDLDTSEVQWNMVTEWWFQNSTITTASWRESAKTHPWRWHPWMGKA